MSLFDSVGISIIPRSSPACLLFFFLLLSTPRPNPNPKIEPFSRFNPTPTKMKMTQFAPPLLLFLLLLQTIAAQSPDDPTMFELRKGLTFSDSSLWTNSDPCKWEKVQCPASDNGRVTRIQIGRLGVSGTLPGTLNKLTELQVFEVMGNNLTGPIPDLSGLGKLTVVSLNENRFQSMPANFFTGLNSLTAFSVDRNQDLAPWKIPDSLKQAAALVNFTASSASVIGTLPNFLGASDGLGSLTKLDLSHNSLEGGLPASFSGSQIMYLYLNGQQLSGSIEVLGSMTNLVEVSLQGNEFTGPIPDMSGLKSLVMLNLRENQLTGPVPDSLIGLQTLKIVNLTNNLLGGKMPLFGSGVSVDNGGINMYCLDVPGAECDWRVNVFLEIAKPLGYPKVLAENWAGNDPCGWLGISCDSSGNVTTVNFRTKGLSGGISPAYSKFPLLKMLFLNNNSLSGTVPNEIGSLLYLKELDISYNEGVYGNLPSFKANGVMISFNGTSIGKDHAPAPAKSPGSSPQPNIGSKSNKSKTIGIVAGAIAGFVIIICLGVFFFICRRKRTARVQSPSENTMVIHPRLSGSDQDIKITIAGLRGPGNEAVSYTSSGPNAAGGDIHVVESGNMVISIQVLKNVTSNFSEDNILGSGGFGTVYKGELHDGTKIAVKRMESGVMSDKGLNEFTSEIAVLTKVRHRHLVALLGYCVEGNERLLVYEYMPQGTLSSHLFHWAKEGLKPLEWSRRLTIALDVARGVEYLHSLAHQSFVHRDLKPSNILLGDDMRAKVADFGLVRLAPDGPDGKMSFATKLAGTFGYLAPEYAVTGRVTTKVDVFSFGVILMELITGRKALDDSQPEESCHLVTWFRRMSIDPDSFRKAIDPALDLTEETLSSIRTVAELAGHCSAREPHQRPDMSHAVNVLSSLAELWKPVDQDADDIYGIDLDMTLPQALKKWQAFEGNSNADFSSSSFFGNSSSAENTQTSIPARPYGFGDSFTSGDGR